MRVHVEQSNTVSHGRSRVKFRSAVGAGVGIWVGPPPLPGRAYDVEFAVPGPIAWGTNLRPTGAEEDVIETTREYVLVRGSLLSHDGDGTVVLDVGGSVLMLDAQGAPCPAARLEAYIPELHLYDAHV